MEKAVQFLKEQLLLLLTNLDWLCSTNKDPLADKTALTFPNYEMEKENQTMHLHTLCRPCT